MVEESQRQQAVLHQNYPELSQQAQMNLYFMYAEQQEQLSGQEACCRRHETAEFVSLNKQDEHEAESSGSSSSRYDIRTTYEVEMRARKDRNRSSKQLDRHFVRFVLLLETGEMVSYTLETTEHRRTQDQKRRLLSLDDVDSPLCIQLYGMLSGAKELLAGPLERRRHQRLHVLYCTAAYEHERQRTQHHTENPNQLLMFCTHETVRVKQSSLSIQQKKRKTGIYPNHHAWLLSALFGLSENIRYNSEHLEMDSVSGSVIFALRRKHDAQIQDLSLSELRYRLDQVRQLCAQSPAHQLLDWTKNLCLENQQQQQQKQIVASPEFADGLEDKDRDVLSRLLQLSKNICGETRVDRERFEHMKTLVSNACKTYGCHHCRYHYVTLPGSDSVPVPPRHVNVYESLRGFLSCAVVLHLSRYAVFPIQLDVSLNSAFLSTVYTNYAIVHSVANPECREMMKLRSVIQKTVCSTSTSNTMLSSSSSSLASQSASLSPSVQKQKQQQQQKQQKEDEDKELIAPPLNLDQEVFHRFSVPAVSPTTTAVAPSSDSNLVSPACPRSTTPPPAPSYNNISSSTCTKGEEEQEPELVVEEKVVVTRETRVLSKRKRQQEEDRDTKKQNTASSVEETNYQLMLEEAQAFLCKLRKDTGLVYRREQQDHSDSFMMLPFKKPVEYSIDYHPVYVS